MRTLCEDLLSVDLAWLNDYPVMRTGHASAVTWHCNGHFTGKALISRLGDTGLKVEIGLHCYPVEFAWTDTPFGGRRRWFACPGCKRACRVLYIGRGGPACRTCLRLGYASEYERLTDTALKRARAIVKRLGGTVTELPLKIPKKPPRMHWSTYFELEARCRELEQLWANQCGAMLGLRGGAP
jgi:hypothetical protein